MSIKDEFNGHDYYELWQKTQRELDSLKMSLGLFEEIEGFANAYDFIHSKTRDIDFSGEWGDQLICDTGREWPSDWNGTYAFESDLEKAWKDYGYEAKFSAHKEKLALQSKI